MPLLQLDAWPPEALITERLVVRAPELSDRAPLMALLTSAATRRYLGGPLSRQDAEAATARRYGRTPGSFVMAMAGSGAFVGTVELDRRDADRPGRLGGAGPALEVSYVLEPAQWGHGYATEAVAAVLDWAPGVLPDTQVVACTQTANTASVALLARLGFIEIDRFVEFDAEQGLWLRPLATIDAPAVAR